MSWGGRCVFAILPAGVLTAPGLGHGGHHHGQRHQYPELARTGLAQLAREVGAGELGLSAPGRDNDCALSASGR